jgi:hypothetical protein
LERISCSAGYRNGRDEVQFLERLFSIEDPTPIYRRVIIGLSKGGL